MTPTLLDSIVHATFFLAIGFILGTLHAEYKQMQGKTPTNPTVTPMQMQGRPSIFLRGEKDGELKQVFIDELVQPLNREAMLYAISQVESGGNPKAVGKNGEVSEWQLSRNVIEDYLKAHPKNEGWLPTYEHVRDWHLGNLIAAHGNDPLAVAKAWNPHAPDETAQRVVNVYEVKVTEMEGAK